MKRILVIEREFGAGGSVIARRAAQRLGWKLLDHELTAEIARLAKVTPEECERRAERVDPWMYRLAKVFWRGSQERSAQFNDADVLDADRLICLTQQAVEEAAAAGHCVIVGRGAPYFLRDREDTFSVFLYAPREVKFQRVRLRSKDDAEAINLVDTVDRERADFIRHYFKAPWPSRHLYHAMLNTAAGEEVTVNTILGLMEAAHKAPGADKA
jgi:cytidylate kinase